MTLTGIRICGTDHLNNFESEGIPSNQSQGMNQNDIYLKRRGEAQRRKLDKIKKRRIYQQRNFFKKNQGVSRRERRINGRIEGVEKQQRVIDQELIIKKKIYQEDNRTIESLRFFFICK